MLTIMRISWKGGVERWGFTMCLICLLILFLLTALFEYFFETMIATLEFEKVDESKTIFRLLV